jgi:hypothetical protein
MLDKISKSFEKQWEENGISVMGQALMDYNYDAIDCLGYLY